MRRTTLRLAVAALFFCACAGYALAAQYSTHHQLMAGDYDCYSCNVDGDDCTYVSVGWSTCTVTHTGGNQNCAVSGNACGDHPKAIAVLR